MSKNFIKIKIGQVINFPVNPMLYMVPNMSIGIVDAGTCVTVPCEVCKYNDSDDPEYPRYKVIMKPMIQGYSSRNVYVSDLKSLIKNGIANIRLSN